MIDPGHLSGCVCTVSYRQFKELSSIYKGNQLLGLVCMKLQGAHPDLRERLVNGKYPKTMEEYESLRWMSEVLHATFTFVVSVPETGDRIPDSAEVYVLESVPEYVSRRFKQML